MKTRTYTTAGGVEGGADSFAHRLGTAMYQVGFGLGTLMLASVQVWQLIEDRGKSRSQPTFIMSVPEANGSA